jgi:hypothetical protein
MLGLSFFRDLSSADGDAVTLKKFSGSSTNNIVLSERIIFIDSN